MILKNTQLIEKQRGIASYLIKQMGRNLLSGQSIMSVSLPVSLSCPESYLERCASSLAYAPVFLEKAAQMNDPVEQIKLAITCLVTRLHLVLQQEKPFNPILGETYQAFIDGNPIYVEQISHHPPVSAFEMFGKGYKVWGQDAPAVGLSANSAKAKNAGQVHISFDNTKIHLVTSYPTIEISVRATFPRFINKVAIGNNLWEASNVRPWASCRA